MLITGSYHRCNVCGDNSELNTVFGLEMERYNTLVNLLWYWHQCQLRRIFEDYKEDNMGFWLQVPKSCLPGWQASHSHPREAPAQLAYSEHAASIWKKNEIFHKMFWPLLEFLTYLPHGRMPPLRFLGLSWWWWFALLGLPRAPPTTNLAKSGSEKLWLITAPLFFTGAVTWGQLSQIQKQAECVLHFR